MGRPTILLLTLVGAMLFACTGVVLAQQERSTPEKAQTPASEDSQSEVVRGSFHVQWGTHHGGTQALRPRPSTCSSTRGVRRGNSG